MTFDQLGLTGELLLAVQAKGYTKPSPIQEKAIPVILEGKDILAAAQTGTGKTAGFTLPLLQNLMEGHHNGRRSIRALVVTPTRELAAQIQENVLAYGKNLPFRSAVIFGGVPQGRQVAILRKGVDILVATPGRLLDLQNQRIVDLSRVEILVLDEADRMLDMGFIHDIKKILALVPKKRQNLLFSATFSNSIRQLATGFMNNPVSVDVAVRNTAAETVEQHVYKVDKKRKPAVLTHLIKKGQWKQVLVFTRTKHGANRLAKKLYQSGINSTAIHGNKSQGARTKALRDFKEGNVQVLVATDIAARGLDIEHLPWVVNFDLPNVAEDYVHRIGRTGRAGKEGKAVSLVSSEEQKLLSAIERLLKKSINVEILEGFEPEENDRSKSTPKPEGQTRKEKGFPQRKQNRRKPKAKPTDQRQQGQRQGQQKEKEKEQSNQSGNSRSNNQKPKNNDRRNQKPNKRKGDSNKKSSNNRSKEKEDKDKIKNVKFSSALKKKKTKKKGPIGYGMWPLE